MKKFLQLYLLYFKWPLLDPKNFIVHYYTTTMASLSKSQVTGETLYFDEYYVHYLHYIYNTFTILLCILNPHTRCVFTGTGQALFDHIASCLSDFVHDRKIENEILPLGFTFSFPCQQQGLAKAKYQCCQLNITH